MNVVYAALLGAVIGAVIGAGLLYLWQRIKPDVTKQRWHAKAKELISVPRDSVEGAMNLIAAGCPIELVTDQCPLAFNKHGAQPWAPRYLPEMDLTVQDVVLNWVTGETNRVVRIITDETVCRGAFARWLAEASFLPGTMPAVLNTAARTAIERLHREYLTAEEGNRALRGTHLAVKLNIYTVAPHFEAQLNGHSMATVTNFESIRYLAVPAAPEITAPGEEPLTA